MRPWTTILRDYQRIQIEILRIAPYRDVGLVPNPPARRRSIDAAERRLGLALPPTYREFLEHHNGWPRFLDGASLLGTADLGKRSYAALIRAVFQAAETPVPDVGPPSVGVPGRPRHVIPFGIDTQATTLFAFDPARRSAGGEMEVVAWVNEIGVRRSTFPDFLAMALELAEAELESLSVPLARSA